MSLSREQTADKPCARYYNSRQVGGAFVTALLRVPPVRNKTNAVTRGWIIILYDLFSRNYSNDTPTLMMNFLFTVAGIPDVPAALSTYKIQT
jgi:hypothetical protein